MHLCRQFLKLSEEKKKNLTMFIFISRFFLLKIIYYYCFICYNYYVSIYFSISRRHLYN